MRDMLLPTANETQTVTYVLADPKLRVMVMYVASGDTVLLMPGTYIYIYIYIIRLYNYQAD